MTDLDKWATEYSEAVTKTSEIEDFSTMQAVREAIKRAYTQGFVDADAHNCDRHNCDKRVP